MQRRSLLSLPFLVPAASGIALAKPRGGRPKNIIFCVSDGMSNGVLMMAEYFSRMARNKGTRWAAMIHDANATRGVQDVASLNSPVTDSSSSSSAWGSGSRIFNAAVNVLPDGTRLTPILQLAKQSGRKTGLVTTATVTHATPAGFAAIEPRRDNEEGIALQYKGVVDVVLGGGQKFFLAEKRKDKKDARYEDYQYVSTKQELMAASKAKALLGLFSDSHIPYTVDQPHMSAPPPTLAEMTEFTLEALSQQGGKGFVLQVEGARVDHAAHDNDIAGQLWDQLAFDDALGVCLDFAQRRGDTLVVVTSDHGNASPGFNGMGTEYVDSAKHFEKILGAKASFDVLAKAMGANASAAMVADVIRDKRGLSLAKGEAELIARSLAGEKGITINAQQDKPLGVLGQVLANHYGVAYTGMNHTGEYTAICAYGPGAAPFEGFVVNTDIFPRLTGYLGIRHKNPSMSVEAAGKYMSAARAGEGRVSTDRYA
jgi:alkaline phosphatase